MDAGVDPAEVAKFRAMMSGGKTLPSMESGSAPVQHPIAKRKKNPHAAGRFQVMNDFCDHSARMVDTTAQATWMILYREVRSNGVARVSHCQIAEMIGVSRRTVVRAVQHLEDAKLVTVVHRGGLTGGTSSYRVHGTPQGCDARVTPPSATRVTGGVTKPVNPA